MARRGRIIGAIAGGGKGAAIGAGSGAGAGAGALTEVLTKGASIRVPAETILTFNSTSRCKSSPPGSEGRAG